MSDSPNKQPVPSSEGTAAKPAVRPNWRPLCVILAIHAMIIAYFLFWPDLYRGLRVVGTMATCGALLICFVAWLLVFSRLARRPKYLALAAVLLPIVAFFSVRRIDTFDGDMFPITAWRWTPRALDDFDAYVGDDGTPVDVAKLRISSDDDYSAFLGRDRRGVVEGLLLATDWEAQPPKELWRHPVGLGWSAFAVAGDFAVTQEQRSVTEPYHECVVAYELRTGKQIWVHTDAELFSQPDALGGPGPRATPTIDGERVYALGATGTLNCLDLTTGEIIWSTNILADANTENVTWGMAGSPLVVDSLVVVCPGGDNGHCVAAYDKRTGQMVWHGGSDEETAGYASPILTTLAGKQQIVMLTGIGLSGYEPTTGEMLWHYPWKFADNQQIICSQPLVTGDFGDAAKDQVLISAGYGVGSEMLKFSQQNNEIVPERVWTTGDIKSKFANMVVRDDSLYGLSEGILTCLDLATGKKRWKSGAGRYGHGQIILVGDVLLIQTEQRGSRYGDVVLVEASPQGFKQLAQLPALRHKTWNPPALIGNLLIVRNDHEAACYELPIIEKE